MLATENWKDKSGGEKCGRGNPLCPPHEASNQIHTNSPGASHLRSLNITRGWGILDNLRTRGTPSSSSPSPSPSPERLDQSQDLEWAWAKTTEPTLCWIVLCLSGPRFHLPRALAQEPVAQVGAGL